LKLSKAWPQFAETWIENWPDGLVRLSFPHIGIRLEEREVDALGALNGIGSHRFDRCREESLCGLEARLDDAIRHFPQGAFIRLGSRSPKDTAYSVITQCKAFDGRQAIRLLTSGSERVAYDLRAARKASYQPWVFVRQWTDISPEMEFRCFMKNRRLIGVSQYFYQTPFSVLASPEIRNTIKTVLDEFFADFSKVSPLDNVVFDVALFLDKAPHVKLIEINPFHPLTQACLFSWHTSDFDGSFRFAQPDSKPEPVMDFFPLFE
jgi:hypothetical protein